MRKYKCPKCGGKKFNVSAHITQGWTVNEHGEWLETTGECEQVIHYPNDGDVWQCASCGHDAAGEFMREGANG